MFKRFITLWFRCDNFKICLWRNGGWGGEKNGRILCTEGHAFKDTEIPDMPWCGHIVKVVCLLFPNSVLKRWVGKYWYGIFFFSNFCRNEIRESANNWISKYKNMLKLLMKICWSQVLFHQLYLCCNVTGLMEKSNTVELNWTADSLPLGQLSLKA